jgi:hypothetical protein
MNPPEKTQSVPTEVSLMAGLAIAWSGQWLIAVLALPIWMGLRRIRPATPPQVVFVSAIVASETLVGWYAVHEGYLMAGALVEILAVFAVGLLLFVTWSVNWAYVLIAHSLFILCMRANDLYQGGFDDRMRKACLGGIALRALLAWQLFDFTRRRVAATPPQSDEAGKA